MNTEQLRYVWVECKRCVRSQEADSHKDCLASFLLSMQSRAAVQAQRTVPPTFRAGVPTLINLI